jgi:hypothetical protein
MMTRANVRLALCGKRLPLGDGTSWTLSDSPIARSATTLYSLAPISSTSIWAVGYIKTSDVQFLPVTEHWDGTSWSVVTPPDPGKVAQLFSASAVGILSVP